MKTFTKIFLTFGLLTLSSLMFTTIAQTTINCTRDGDWGDASIWDLGRKPHIGDDVHIAGKSVTLTDTSSTVVTSIHLDNHSKLNTNYSKSLMVTGMIHIDKSSLDIYSATSCNNIESDNYSIICLHSSLTFCYIEMDNSSKFYGNGNDVTISNCTNISNPVYIHGGATFALDKDCNGNYLNSGNLKINGDVTISICNSSYNNIIISNGTLDFGSCNVNILGKVTLNPGGNFTTTGTVTYGSNAELVFKRSYTLTSTNDVWATGTGSGVPPVITVDSGTITTSDTFTVLRRINLLGGIIGTTSGTKIKLANDSEYICGGRFQTIPTFGANVTISSCSSIVVSAVSQTNVTCYGLSNGSITLSSNGGTAPYLWSKDGINYQSSATFTGLSAGSYTIKCKDVNGLSTSYSVTITQPLVLNASIGSQTNINCYNALTGAISVNVNGGTTPYTYLWTNSATTASINNVPSGMYSVIVTDAKACVATQSSLITQPSSALIAGINSQTNATYYGATNGTASISASGGTTPYTYLWSNLTTTTNVSGLAAGFYSVTVTDAKGCRATQNFSITQPAQLVVSITSQTNETYFGGTSGSITASATGGVTPYTWSKDGINFQSSSTFSGLTAGSYSIRCKDASGIVASQNATITQPALLVVSITSQTNETYYGGASGSLIASATGGVTPYTWSKDGINFQSTSSFSGLTAGTYTITCKDANGVVASQNATITQPAQLIVSITSQTNETYYGGASGSITASATGGVTPYTWSKDGINFQSSSTFSGLTAGTYTITCKDANGIVASQNATITQPAQLVVSITSQTNETYYGGASGSLTASATGGVTPYTWSKDGINFQSTSTFSGLTAGSYTITCKDANGVTASQNATITQPAQLVISISSQTNANCYGTSTGSFTASASGGVAPYTWSIDGINYQSSAIFGGLAAGTYTVSIKDANGVITTQNITISQPTQLVSTVSTQTNVNVSCNCYGSATGTITASASGGVGPYTWSIDGINFQTSSTFSGLAAGTYTISCKDANGIIVTKTVTLTIPAQLVVSITSQTNATYYGGATGSLTASATGGVSSYTWSKDGINFQSTSTFSGLTAGTYTITCKDANGVTASQNATITQPAQLIVSISSQTNETYYGGASGSITASAIGGVTPYTWAKDGINFQSSSTFSGLTAGTYTISCKDANGIVATQNATITQPAQLIITIPSQINVNCYGNSTGSFTASATGGVSPYTWSKDGINYQSSSTFSGFAAGNYTLRCKDANNYIVVKSISISQPAVLSGSISSQTNILCYAQVNGSVTLTATGGTSPYTWSKDGITYQSSSTFSSLSAKLYTISLKDSKGCASSVNVTITRPATPFASAVLSQTNAACYGTSTGSVNMSGTGGVTPYTWSIDAVNYQSSSTFSGLPAGNYTIKGKDANGCIETKFVTITQPALLVARIGSQTNLSCYNSTDGSISLTVSGGTSPYTYSWSNSATTSTINGLAEGTYSVIVTDTKGCSATQSASITQPLITSVKTGNWNDPTVWDLGRVPTACDNVHIGNSNTITISQNNHAYSANILCDGGSKLYINDTLDCREFNSDNTGTSIKVYGQLNACSMTLDHSSSVYACSNLSLSNCTKKVNPLKANNSAHIYPLGGSYCSTVAINFNIDSSDVDLTNLCSANVGIQTLYIKNATVTLSSCNNIVDYIKLDTGGDCNGNTPTWTGVSKLAINRDYNFDANSILWIAGTGNVPHTIDILNGDIQIKTPKTVVTKMQLLGGTVSGGNKLNFANNSYLFRCGGVLKQPANMGTNVTVEMCSDTNSNNPEELIDSSDMPTGDLIISTKVVLGTNITVPGKITVTKTGILNDSTFNVSNATSVQVDSGAVVYTSKSAGLTGTNSLVGSLPITVHPKSTVVYNASSGTQTISAISTYGNIVCENSADKILASNSSATVYGDLTNTGNGKIKGESGSTINFEGNNQKVAGVSYYNVNFKGTGNTNITGTSTVTANMTVASGSVIKTNDHLSLLSNINGTAQIGSLLNGADVQGNVCWHRFIPGGANNRRWNFLACPIKNVTFRWWQNDIFITGSGTGGTPCSWNTTSTSSMHQNSNGFDQNVGSVASCFKYNSSTGAWASISSTYDTINPLVGYRTFVRGDRNIEGCILMTAMPDSVSSVTLRSCGPIVKFTQTVPLTYTTAGGGWNYVTNPYPCSIDWMNSTWKSLRSSKVNGVIYIWNPDINQYASFHPIAGGTLGACNIIGTGQSFFIKTSAAANLIFEEDYKLDSGQIGLFGKGGGMTYSNNLKINLSSSSTKDEAVVFITDSATLNYEESFDALKMGYTISSIASHTKRSTSKLVFNGIGNVSAIDTVILDAYLATTTTSYTLNFKGYNNFDPTYILVLRDKYLGVTKTITSNYSYTFTTTTGVAASYSQTRFEIIIMNSTSLPVTLTNFAANKQANKTVLVKWSTASEINNSHFIVEHSTDATKFTQIGVVKGAGNTTSLTNYSYIHSNPVNGINYYRLTQVDKNNTTALSYVIAVDMSEEVLGSISLFPVPVNNILNINFGNAEFNGNVSIKILDFVGRQLMTKQITVNAKNQVSNMDVSKLNSGTYIINIVSENGTEQNIKFIKD